MSAEFEEKPRLDTGRHVTVLRRERGPLPEGHPEIPTAKTGVLLVNLGTPDGYDKKNMRRYLKEFLSDHRVIELPKLLWYPILHGVILNVRPKKSGAAYETIWDKERDESPLRTISRSQAELLAERLEDKQHVLVEWALRYGNPPIAEKLQALHEQGCDRIVIFPLYPQYSATTTASVNDKAFETLMEMRWMPAVRTVPPYHDDPAYIAALATSIRQQIEALDFEPEKIIASYHGIPVSYFEKGDPYHCHCHKTTRLLREHLGWSEDRLLTCFQSRFGPQEWLQSYTDQTVEQLAQDGVRRIAVFNPGFVADCLETLEEIAVEVRDLFLESGGERFAHLRCLNDTPEGMDVLETVVRRELAGWV
ncbi:MAG: ferrochelatase [Gammaproteobacteria bacterium]